MSNDLKRLQGTLPALQAKAMAIMWEMRQIGKPMMVTDGYRSPAEQRRLYSIGRRGIPGERIVTTLRFGRHNEGKAADCCFIVNGKATWDVPESWWQEYGRRARRRGLRWGGDWRKFKDRPHIELP